MPETGPKGKGRVSKGEEASPVPFDIGLGQFVFGLDGLSELVFAKAIENFPFSPRALFALRG
jgi:hypothetical protein